MAQFKLHPENPPRLTEEEQTRLHKITDAEITAAAEGDPENPPLTADELNILDSTAFVRGVRRRAGMSQADFAEAFEFSLGRLRDLEQGRTQIDTALRAYLTVIAQNPLYVLVSLGKGPDGQPTNVGAQPQLMSVISREYPNGVGLDAAVSAYDAALRRMKDLLAGEVVRAVRDEMHDQIALLSGKIEEFAAQPPPQKRRPLKRRLT
jgi:putative transcriptional regulator